jgi:molybdate transport system substrate-binding protein
MSDYGRVPRNVASGGGLVTESNAKSRRLAAGTSPPRAAIRRLPASRYRSVYRIRPLSTMLGLVLAAVLFVASCDGADSAGAGRPDGDASPVELLVSAAGNLTPVLQELGPLFEEASGYKLLTNIASTGQLMEQIVAGAPVDVFLAADRSATDQLDQQGLLVSESVEPYCRGRLVLWTRPGSSVSVKTVQDLTAPDVKRISLANPDHAPYGRAAREALESAGLWDDLQPKLVPAENVNQAFQFAESGNTDVGMVALSLVILADGNYELVPEELHEPLLQTLAIVATSPRRSEAEQFVAYLTGDQGRAILQKYGFMLPDKE